MGGLRQCEDCDFWVMPQSRGFCICGTSPKCHMYTRYDDSCSRWRKRSYSRVEAVREKAEDLGIKLYGGEEE